MLHGPPSAPGARVRTLIVALCVLVPLLVGLPFAGTPPAGASDAPRIDNTVDLGPLMIQPWGTPPPGATFDGLWTSSRDCGFSKQLSDGRYLWIFCDGLLYDQNQVYHGNFAFNAAALASVNNPMVVRDVLAGGQYTQFIETQTFYPCDGGFRATWPTSVGTLPDHDGNPRTDRVIIYFQNNCVGPKADGNWGLTQYDVGVALWDYDADKQPAPLRATVLNARLFPGMESVDFRSGAIVAPDAVGVPHLHLYSCGIFGFCYLRRVLVSTDPAADATRLANPFTYQAWDGTGFSNSAPEPLFGGGGQGAASEESVSVAWMPAIGRYVMTYMPWPLLNDITAIRTAPKPEGPWSDPVIARLPGCETTKHCYAANLHPQFADADHIAVSYLKWDDFVANENGTPTWRGRIHVTKIPFKVPRTAAVTVNNKETVIRIHNGLLQYEYYWDGRWWKWFRIGTKTWKGAPAVAVIGGRMAVFATDANGVVHHTYQRADGKFDELTPLASNITSSAELAVATTGDGRLEVFTTDATGRVFHIWEQVVDGTKRWSSLGFWPVISASTFRATKGIAATTSADGRVELFGVNAAGKVSHVWQKRANAVTEWSSLGFWPVLSSTTFNASRGIAAATGGDGRVRLFAVGANGQVGQLWQTAPNAFTSWATANYQIVAGSDSAGGVSAAQATWGAIAAYTIDEDRMHVTRGAEAQAGVPSSFSGFAEI